MFHFRYPLRLTVRDARRARRPPVPTPSPEPDASRTPVERLQCRASQAAECHVCVGGGGEVHFESLIRIQEKQKKVGSHPLLGHEFGGTSPSPLLAAVPADREAPHISICLLSDAIQDARRRTHPATWSGFLRAHAQTVATRQPSAKACRRTAASLATFASNLDSQNSLRVAGTVLKRHPAWRCQKHPCTNTTARWRGRTMSGRPGIPER